MKALKPKLTRKLTLKKDFAMTPESGGGLRMAFSGDVVTVTFMPDIGWATVSAYGMGKNWSGSIKTDEGPLTFKNWPKDWLTTL